MSAQRPTPSDETWGRLNRPVINVNAKDAEAYAAWLTSNNDVGLSCRLPTEAEWEYAARAGTRTRYSWGDAADQTKANCAECDTHWSQQKQTAPVTSLQENNFGLKNMHGNVAEWVQDIWHDNYDNALSNGQAWLRGGYANKRVVRGGSWADKLDDLRSARRIGALETERFRTIGFRVVCTAGNR
jgi:formylglycine-generating enzyme required for sulfatase activity